VYCANKQAAQIEGVLAQHDARRHACLLTRLSPKQFASLGEAWRARLDYDPVSRTAFFLEGRPLAGEPRVAVVSGGSSDAAICGEAARTLAFHGVASTRVEDVGVAGLWRLMERLDEIRRHPVVIAVAGMEGALFSVLGGLVGGVVIAVPSSVGYGVAGAGDLSLRSALASCAPGIVTVNIDNGYGAACAALRVLGRATAAQSEPQ
jgi:NCAIR mutase (PurE)-related protein